MPNADGKFIGTGWSQAREDAWTRIFGPSLADDPCCSSGFPEVPCANCPRVPSEPAPEVTHAPDDYGWPSTYGGEPR